MQNGRLQVERLGTCSGHKNIARLRLEHARKYASVGSASQALAAMRQDGVPEDDTDTNFNLLLRFLKEHPHPDVGLSNALVSQQSRLLHLRLCRL